MTIRITGVLSSNIEPQTGDVWLGLQADNGQQYGITIARPVAALFVVTVVGQMQRSREKFANSPDFQPATLTDARKFFDPDGKPGLTLLLDGGLPLGIQVPREKIPHLQNELRQLWELASPPESGSPPH